MLSIFIRTILFYVLLNIMLKIMGKRQIGELEVSELVSTLLISEIAAAPLTDGNIPILYAVIPILFICAMEISIAFTKNKLDFVKKAVEGKALYIIYKGRLRQKVLSDNRISMNEILTEMRIQGIGDISEVEYALLEQNGKISLLKKDEGVTHTLIIDGSIDQREMSEVGLSEGELERLIGGKKTSEVFLLTLDDNGKKNIIWKDGKK